MIRGIRRSNHLIDTARSWQSCHRFRAAACFLRIKAYHIRAFEGASKRKKVISIKLVIVTGIAKRVGDGLPQPFEMLFICRMTPVPEGCLNNAL